MSDCAILGIVTGLVSIVSTVTAAYVAVVTVRGHAASSTEKKDQMFAVREAPE